MNQLELQAKNATGAKPGKMHVSFSHDWFAFAPDCMFVLIGNIHVHNVIADRTGIKLVVNQLIGKF